MNTDQRRVQDWDEYARRWNADEKRSSHNIPPGHRLEFLGDEWSGEGCRENATNYGLPPAVTADFSGYVDAAVLWPHLPGGSACVGMEIGPGAGGSPDCRSTVARCSTPSRRRPRWASTCGAAFPTKADSCSTTTTG